MPIEKRAPDVQDAVSYFFKMAIKAINATAESPSEHMELNNELSHHFLVLTTAINSDSTTKETQ